MLIKIQYALEFEGIYNKIKDIKMPIKTAYKFSKLVNQFEEDKKFYQSKLQEIIDKYSEKNADGTYMMTEDGNGVQIQKSKLEDCQKEISELSNLEIEINNIKFSIDELEGFELTPRDMNILMVFIEEL